jgi:uncharacterized protein (TIGR02271 family)
MVLGYPPGIGSPFKEETTMTMSMETAAQWRGREVIDRSGDKVGKVEEIYLDTETNEPEWVLVKTGLFGGKSTFVPIEGAAPEGDGLRVTYDKDLIKDAPKLDADQELSSAEEQELYAHYGRAYQDTGSGAGTRDTGREPVGEDVSGPETDDAMTRSEDELRVGTQSRERGRVRLKKYVVTEEVQQTVPVQREEVRLEREPITEGNVDAATDGPAISEEEHEVTLREEVPVVDKVAVPKERVRLDKDTVQGEQTVSDEVRQERIDVDDDADLTR